MISSFCPFPSIFLFRLLSFSTARCVAVHQRTASHRIASRSLPSLHFLLYSFATCIFLNSHFILGNKKSRAFPFFFLWRWCSCCCCVDGCPYAHGHKGSSSHRPIVASRSWISNYRLLLFIALHCTALQGWRDGATRHGSRPTPWPRRTGEEKTNACDTDADTDTH